jgi:ribosome-associated protein
MIRIDRNIAIDEKEIEESFVRSSGPGGQNVNKVATAVQLKFDVFHSASLTDAVRKRLVRLAGRRISKDGVLVIEARRFRSQEQNRKDALERFIGLIRSAAEPPRPRRPTKPTLQSKRRRLEVKKHRGGIKRVRQKPPEDE